MEYSLDIMFPLFSYNANGNGNFIYVAYIITRKLKVIFIERQHIKTHV